MSIVSKLYNGEINPGRSVIPQNPKYHEISTMASNSVEDLEKRLNQEDLKEFSEIKNFYCQMTAMENEESYISGFELGVSIIIEVFLNNKYL